MIDGYEWVHWTLLSAGIMGIWGCFLAYMNTVIKRKRAEEDE